MIHIERGSRYDGYFEQAAERIQQRLTPDLRDTLLRLKYETPDDRAIIGAVYYQAVLEGGVQTYEEFTLQHRIRRNTGYPSKPICPPAFIAPYPVALVVIAQPTNVGNNKEYLSA